MSKKKLWKKIIFIFIGLSLFAGSFSYFYLDNQDAVKSEFYFSGDQRFKVKFPTNPKESSQEMEIANTKIEYHETSSKAKNSLFAVSYIDFPSHWTWLGTEKLLNKSFDGFVENEKNVEEVLHRELTTHNGDSALAYRIKQNGKEIQGKFVISGNTLYRVAVTYPLAAAEKIKPENFIDSFELQG